MSALSAKYYSLNIVNYVIKPELVKFKYDIVLDFIQDGRTYMYLDSKLHHTEHLLRIDTFLPPL